MIGYYRNHILRLSAQLQELHANLDNLQLLLSLQFYILRRILHTEGKISEYRDRCQTLRTRLKSGRLPRDPAARLKRELSATDARRQQYQRLLFVWRCFGDGIAFAYLDKYAMKPLLYNVENPSAKQTSGYIGGKEGLQREITVLKKAVDAGVPALLTDLTNSIRHGDVCLLSGSDPHLIEVKSSDNANRRTARQAESLSSIHDYLAKDEAFNVRGMPHIKRVELNPPERNHIGRLDDAVRSALASGLCVIDLEPGTRLVVIGGARNPDYNQIFAGLERARVYLLNMAKNAETWGCYYPFTLSLTTPECLYAFLHGDVYIIVAFDLARVEAHAAELGLIFSELRAGDWVYQFEQRLPGSMEPLVSKISTHFADRMAFELISWEWALEMESLLFEQLRGEIAHPPSPIVDTFLT